MTGQRMLLWIGHWTQEALFAEEFASKLRIIGEDFRFLVHSPQPLLLSNLNHFDCYLFYTQNTAAQVAAATAQLHGLEIYVVFLSF